MQEENIEKPKTPPFFVFNFNTALGIILFIGLVVLYVLFFTSRKSPEPLAPLAAQKSTGKALSVVFVNIDSLNIQYEYIKILRNDLESTGKRLQSEVLSEQAALEKEASDFQRQISSNSIPEDKAKVIYEQLMAKQQALMQKKDRYTQQISEQEMNMNLQLIDSVTTFLKRFNRQYQFDYIMGYKTGGEILVSNDSLDITKSVVIELNKEYQQRKK
jgi:Skp family chaperone for outer membrane proteins